MIVGPWTGELGFELLKWIPYIRRHNPTIAISRGGTDGWYPEGCRVVNLYDVVTPDEFREHFLKRCRERNSSKQYEVDDLDRLILKRLKLRTDLHPSQLYNHRDAPAPVYERLRRPERLPGLPDEYVAVRLYQNDWLRDPPKICERLPIVALRTNGLVDTHTELSFKADIVIECDIKTAIATQNQVIAHAKKFICPYGGMVYVGLLHGIAVEAHSHSQRTHPWMQTREQTMIQKFGGSLCRL
jgi:hypothetical protein